MIRYRIDPALDIPIYQQLVDAIRTDIKKGDLPDGTQLPTVQTLSEELGIARGTIKRAYDQLAHLGLVSLIQGRGTFVSYHPTNAASRKEKAMIAIDGLLNRLEEIAKFHDANFVHGGSYPAWEYKKESRLRDTMVRVYREVYGEEPQVVAIHAGLECGLLSEKIEGLDCVSIGPQMYDIHTSRERLNIASTERTWKYLLEILKNL